MPPPKQVQKESKPVIKLAPPYTIPSWPEVGSEEHETILNMLCALLEPVGAHRRATSLTLKHKRPAPDNDIGPESSSIAPQKQDEHALAPQISAHVLVGLNSVTRHLESLAHVSNPSNYQKSLQNAPRLSNDAAVDNNTKGTGEIPTHVCVLFVPIPKNQIIHDHLPLLAQTASKAHEELPATRILRLREPAEERLAAALELHRVGVIGLCESAVAADSQARALAQFVRGLIEPMKVPWLEEAGKWMGIKVISDAEDKKR